MEDYEREYQARRTGRLWAIGFMSGILALTAGSVAVIFYANKKCEDALHNDLPVQVRKYDLNKDGILTARELEAMLKDYQLKRVEEPEVKGGR